MSNAKLSASEIVELMVKDRMISKKSAEEFVKVFFSVIEDALIDGETVKIKGLGTFKSQWNEARKSVNVNTGEEILIEGFYRATFIPENELRELINEPFAHLEPVELDALSEKNTEQMTDNEEDEHQDDMTGPMEPLRVFEEQAEEIKELLSEINALTPGKAILTETMSDEVNKETTTPEEIKQEAVVIENIVQTPDETEEIREETETADEPTKQLKSESKDHKESEIDLDDFDIIRDISAKLGTATAVSVVAGLSQQEILESTVETESDLQQIKAVDAENAISEDIEPDELTEMLEETETDTDEKTDDETAEYADDENSKPEDDKEENAEVEENEDDEGDDETDKKEIEDKIASAEVPVDEVTIQAEEKITTAENLELLESPAEKEEPKADMDKKAVLSVSEAPVKKRRLPAPEPEKKKRPVWLLTVMGAIALTAVLLAAFLLVKKNLEQQRNKMYMEYLADSTVRVLQVLKAEDSLSLAGDSLQTTDSVAVKNSDQPPSGGTAEGSVSGNVFEVPRTYSQLITTEKMVSGSQLTKFARQYYGHPNFWVYIFEANRDVIKDPNNVPLGISVKIPKLDARLADPKSKESLNYALKLQAEYLK